MVRFSCRVLFFLVADTSSPSGTNKGKFFGLLSWKLPSCKLRMKISFFRSSQSLYTPKHSCTYVSKMATLMRRFLADSLTAVKNVFSRTSSPNAAANANSNADKQSTRRTRQPASPAPLAGPRVISGRVPSSTPSKRRRPCRNIEDYKFRLERLITGIDSLENVEELRDERQYQIADIMMISDIDPTVDQRIDTLIEQQDRAEVLIDKRLKILQTDADALVQSLEPDTPTDRPPLLPFYLRSQLKTYDRARSIYQTQVTQTSNSQHHLDKISAILLQANEQQARHGWLYTRSYIERLHVRRAGICKQRRVAESCRQRFALELRKLCKKHVPKTLQDENFPGLFSNRMAGEMRRRDGKTLSSDVMGVLLGDVFLYVSLVDITTSSDSVVRVATQQAQWSFRYGEGVRVSSRWRKGRQSITIDAYSSLAKALWKLLASVRHEKVPGQYCERPFLVHGVGEQSELSLVSIELL
ncbi:uncharacterized protein MYCFIDRAFT_173391 [Pseudocercospora fijiensis CIRAD86]|uniref:Uncharacterized protein n=1 Tax=Pseudocercospora fijiensis (strain CIRAD86) TaxID=383855 RepID=M3B4V5_PSEFD|nr:uncharacterized protein MYCFIDRAFT_173391 [Pseudocercospora fijiensis CIRAD86]EME84387.1 hypothetical protein MYCFIDRAFT_173391 [Pseudocercospora fijiensis CIRAD86]